MADLNGLLPGRFHASWIGSAESGARAFVHSEWARAAGADRGTDLLFNWITNVVSEYGYPGIALLMLGENIFPPIPSELIMPLAGFVAAQGQLNPVLVVLAGTLG